MSDSRIERIVEAVSDGEHVDWDSVRRQLTDRVAADSCAHLETVSKIGQLVQDREAAQQDVGELPWVSILMAFAIVQIALGIVGAIMYRSPSFLNALRLLTILSFAGMGIVLRQSRHNLRARDLGAVFLLCALGFSRTPYTLLFDAWLSGFAALSVLRSGVAIDAWAPYFFWEFARRFPTTARFTVIDRTAIALAKVAGVGRETRTRCVYRARVFSS